MRDRIFTTGYPAFPAILLPSVPSGPYLTFVEQHIIDPVDERVSRESREEPDTVFWHDLHDDMNRLVIDESGRPVLKHTNGLTAAMVRHPSVRDIVRVSHDYIREPAAPVPFVLVKRGSQMLLMDEEDLPLFPDVEILRQLRIHYIRSLSEAGSDVVDNRIVDYHLDLDELIPVNEPVAVSVQEYSGDVWSLRESAGRVRLATCATSPGYADLQKSHIYLRAFRDGWQKELQSFNRDIHG